MLATVIPLCLLQVPYAPFPQFANAGATAAQAGGPAGVLRAASLALPFAVSAAPLAALAIRRLRAWRVLLAGLVIMLAAGGLAALASAGAGHSGVLAALAGAVRGVGAGMALAATVAMVAEHAGPTRRLLAACWAAAAVAALAVASGLGPQQAAGWHAVLGPVPWLTVAALAATLLYRRLAGGPWLVRRRGEGAADSGARAARGPRAVRPYAEPARLALLAPAATALGVIATAVTYRPSSAIIVVAVCAVACLLVMAGIAVHGAADGGFALLCAVAGFFIAPASAALAGLRAMASAGAPAGAVASGALIAAAAVIGAIAGAGITLAGRRAGAPAGVPLTGMSLVSPVFGLLLAAGALVAASMAGPFAGPAVLVLLVAAVTGGLAAALAGPAAQVTLAGAMAGAVMLAAGALAGYVAAAAIRVQTAGATLAGTFANPAGHLSRTGVIAGGSTAGPDAVPHALVTAAGWWELAAATVAVLAVFARYAPRVRAEAAVRWQPRHGRGLASTTGWGADQGTDRDAGPGPDQEPGNGTRREIRPMLRTNGGAGGAPRVPEAASGHAASGDRGGRRVHQAHG